MTNQIKRYAPIIWISGVVALVSAAACLAHGLSFGHWMHGWMGGVLVIFSLFKLFDIGAFANDFAKYDLLASRLNWYGRAYPFLELGLGIAFLCMILPAVTYGATLLLFGFGLIGVVKALASGNDFQCACVGRLFNLPLSRVAVIENSTMVAMSGVMLAALVLA